MDTSSLAANKLNQIYKIIIFDSKIREPKLFEEKSREQGAWSKKSFRVVQTCEVKLFELNSMGQVA